MDEALAPLPLPPGVRARFVDGVNGLRMHVLEGGEAAAPTLLLLHGFPELAFSWRSVMPSLAAAGFRVVAPDQRGYGRTTGWADSYDADLAPFRQMGLVTDMLALLAALEIGHVAAVVGHDFGSPVAAWSALIRPDVFRAVALMSAPFAGPPGFGAGRGFDLDAALAGLDPPRRHYTRFFSMPQANDDLLKAPQGLAAFLRGYIHAKSGDFAANAPHPLGAPSAEAYAQLPAYYVMPRAQGMAATIARMIPEPPPAARWQSEDDLAVYVREFGRTGFQGGLNWYRASGDSGLRLFSGRAIDVPAAFIGGDRDWGVFQAPGAYEAMAARGCSNFLGAELIPGAGHWVQQEAPQATAAAILAFLGKLRRV